MESDIWPIRKWFQSIEMYLLCSFAFNINTINIRAFQLFAQHTLGAVIFFFRPALIQSIIIHKLAQIRKHVHEHREIWLLQNVRARSKHHSHVIIAPMKIRNYRFIEQINFLHGKKYGWCLQDERARHANNEKCRTRKKLSKTAALFNDCLFDHWIIFVFPFFLFLFDFIIFASLQSAKNLR